MQIECIYTYNKILYKKKNKFVNVYMHIYMNSF